MPNLRSLLPAASLLSLLAAPALADHATYELRGIVSEVYFNAFTEKVEAIVQQPETHYLAFCDTPACDDDLYAALGTCTHLTGTLEAQFISPPYTSERFHISTVEAAVECPQELSPYSVLGRLTAYFPASGNNSGLPEFNVSMNGATFRMVCDPTYGACALRASQNVGRCVLTSGDGESFVLGFFGDMAVINWTLSVARVFGCA